MSLSRRHFFRNLGLGSAGLLSTPFIIGRGHEAMAFEVGALQPPDDGGFIRISSNENARGPGRKTMDALRNTITPRVGRGYPPDYTGEIAFRSARSEEHTSELQSQSNLVCRLLLEKKKNTQQANNLH